MQVPYLIQLAVTNELAEIIEVSFRMTLPPNAVVEGTYEPPTEDWVYLKYRTTWGDMVPNAVAVTLESRWYMRSRQIIGPEHLGLEMPRWLMISHDDPVEWKVENLTPTTQNYHCLFFMAVFRKRERWREFLKLVKGAYNTLMEKAPLPELLVED